MNYAAGAKCTKFADKKARCHRASEKPYRCQLSVDL
jgi:hypothetical protein